MLIRFKSQTGREIALNPDAIVRVETMLVGADPRYLDEDPSRTRIVYFDGTKHEIVVDMRYEDVLGLVNAGVPLVPLR